VFATSTANSKPAATAAQAFLMMGILDCAAE
jgi:hypothetical protein